MPGGLTIPRVDPCALPGLATIQAEISTETIRWMREIAGPGALLTCGTGPDPTLGWQNCRLRSCPRPGWRADESDSDFRPARAGRPQTARSTIIFLIDAMALAGFRPLGQVLAQFMIVWQR